MWFKKEEWGHCKTFKVRYHPGFSGDSIYIHLYESKTGKRKFELGMAGTSNLNDKDARAYVKKTELYQERIVRWLNGRHDTEIPTYAEMPLDDTANALKGVNE